MPDRVEPNISREVLFEKLNYEPHSDAQWAMHRSKSRFRIPCCGRRFGKSIMAAREMTLKMFVPDSVNWIVGPDYSLGEKEFRVVYYDFQKLGLLKYCNKSYNVKQGNMRIHFKELNSLLEVKSAERPDCYDAETEILTRRGWLHFYDLSDDDEVLTLSDEGNSEWQKPTRYIEHDYNGPMIHISSRRLDLLITPEHKLLVENVKTKKRRRATAFELGYNDAIPTSSNWIGNDKENLTEDMCALIGIYIAEGSVYIDDKNYRVHITQSDGEKGGGKGNVLDQLVELLNRLSINFSYSTSGVVFHSKFWALYFKQLGKRHEKFIPDEIKDLPPHKLQSLFKWMILGDGVTKGGWKDINYYTTSERLADDFQEVAVKLGFSATKRIKPQASTGVIVGRRINSTRTLYAISCFKAPHAYLRASNKKIYMSPIMYEGKIYCVEVPNQTVMVRRNGKQIWCGNSLVGEGLDHVILSEAAKHKMSTWQMYVQPGLGDKRGSADFPSTPQGYNWYEGLYQLGQHPEYEDYASWRLPAWANPILYPGGFDPQCPNILEDHHYKHYECQCDSEIIDRFNHVSSMYFWQEYGAEFTSFEGMIYPEFDERFHIRDFEYNPAWENWWAMDFGYSDPFICLDIMIDPEDRVYIWREYVTQYKSTHEHGLLLKNRSNPEGFHVDAIAADPRGADQIATLSVMLGSILANAIGVDPGYEAVKQSMKRREDGTYGLYIHPRCTETIRSIKNLRASENKSGYELTRGQFDHPADALRYFFNERFVLRGSVNLAEVYDAYRGSEAAGFFQYQSDLTLNQQFS